MLVSYTHHRKYCEDLLDEPFESRCFLAKDKGTTPEALEVLSKDSSWWVRDFVARNLNTPIPALKELYRDKDFRIRNSVKLNATWKKYVQEHTLESLILAADEKVKKDDGSSLVSRSIEMGRDI